MINAFIYGVLLALGLIIPLGVQNVFIFNQGATQKHFLLAMPSVITAFVCDVILIILAVLGISLLVFSIPALKTAVFVVGISFLIYMGWVTWKSRVNLREDYTPLPVKRQVSFAISVSILNPHALLDTVGVIGTNSLSLSGSAKWAYTLGCILVSFCWFLSLSIAGYFLNRLDKSGLTLLIVNKLSALIMWLIAMQLAWQLCK
jgi:L-lysine exporter family protein LysE/ArgO